MSNRLDFRGVALGAYAPPDSYRYHLRKRRLARLRAEVLRPETACLVLAMALLVLLGVSSHWDAAHVILHWLGVA